MTRGVPVADSRAARKAATRDSIADALLDLLGDGNLRPTAREIAQQAGLSVRSVYVHFDDLEDLYCVAAQRQFGRVGRLLDRVPDEGPLRLRAEALMRSRSLLYEHAGMVGRATQLQAPFSPTLARIIRDAHARSCRELERVFALELDPLAPQPRAQLVAVVDVLMSLDSWHSLRTTHDFSTAVAAASVVDAVIATLEAAA